MWIKVEDQTPSIQYLRSHGYVEDWIYVWNIKGPGMEPIGNYLSNEDKGYYTHWMPILAPGNGTCLCRECGAECQTNELIEATIETMPECYNLNELQSFVAGMGYAQAGMTEKLAEILATREGA